MEGCWAATGLRLAAVVARGRWIRRGEMGRMPDVGSCIFSFCFDFLFFVSFLDFNFAQLVKGFFIEITC